MEGTTVVNSRWTFREALKSRNYKYFEKINSKDRGIIIIFFTFLLESSLLRDLYEVSRAQSVLPSRRGR